MIREIWEALKRWWTEPELAKVEALDLTPQHSAGIPQVNREGGDMGRGSVRIIPDFAVARGPRHTPWSRRRKELEASARQKRREREEWRESE